MPNTDPSLSDEQVVRQIYPDAYINDDYSGAPSADVGVFRKATKEDWPKTREIPISGFFATPDKAWADARSKLPAAVSEPSVTNPDTTCSHCGRDVNRRTHETCSHGGLCITITERNERRAELAAVSEVDGLDVDFRTGHAENCPVTDGYPKEACDCFRSVVQPVSEVDGGTEIEEELPFGHCNYENCSLGNGHIGGCNEDEAELRETIRDLRAQVLAAKAVAPQGTVEGETCTCWDYACPKFHQHETNATTYWKNEYKRMAESVAPPSVAMQKKSEPVAYTYEDGFIDGSSRAVEALKPAVVTSDAGVVEGIFTSYESALAWARKHRMDMPNVRGGGTFHDVQFPTALPVAVQDEELCWSCKEPIEGCGKSGWMHKWAPDDDYDHEPHPVGKESNALNSVSGEGSGVPARPDCDDRNLQPWKHTGYGWSWVALAEGYMDALEAKAALSSPLHQSPCLCGGTN